MDRRSRQFCFVPNADFVFVRQDAASQLANPHVDGVAIYQASSDRRRLGVTPL